MSVYKPSWFSDSSIMVSTASTCGLTKGGRLLPLVNLTTGERIQLQDPETGELIEAINDQLLEDSIALKECKETDTLRFIDREEFNPKIAVPIYYDRRFDDAFKEALTSDFFKGFTGATLQELAEKELIEVKGGHGSPSHDQRIGEVPYIKVSDLRAGLVNINPTNRVLEHVARRFWRGNTSGLRAFDLLCPERTSKNIGDFCVLMPGQEQILLTKEIIVLRPGRKANFDSFFLLWAMTLKIVRDQWRRVVFMQTNREDVGKRYLEISIPIPSTSAKASEVSEPFRKYFTAIADERKRLSDYLAMSNQHHFFVSGAEVPDSSEQLLADLIDEVSESVDQN